MLLSTEYVYFFKNYTLLAQVALTQVKSLIFDW